MDNIQLRNQKMPPNSRRAAIIPAVKQPEPPRLNRPLLMGYLFLFLVFAGSVSSVYYWENKSTNGNYSATPHPVGRVESGESAPPFDVQIVPTPNGIKCLVGTMPGESAVPQPTPPGYNGECD